MNEPNLPGPDTGPPPGANSQRLPAPRDQPSGETVIVEGDTEVTLKRDPKTDGLRRATQKAELKCRERKLVKNLQVHKSRELAGRCRGADCAEKASNADTERQVATREDK